MSSMKIIDYDEQVYGKLSVWKQILLYLLNLSARLYHGKEEWERMNSRWKAKRRATEITRLGKIRFYENHRR